MRNRKWIWLLAVTCLLGVATLYHSLSNVYGYRAKPISSSKDDYILRLDSYSDYLAVQGAPLSAKMNNVLSVKVVQDINSNTVYFINARKYRFHYDFCRLILQDGMPLELFNTTNYGKSMQRRYVLANLNYYEQSHLYTLEIASEDRATAKMINTLTDAVLKRISMHDSVCFLINSDYLLSMDNDGKLTMPRIYPAELYKGQKYQLLNAGVAYGILKDVAAINDTELTRNYIVLMKGSPVNVPVCAGIITDALQSPLSHINVLCHNRNIPSAADVTLYSRPDITENLNKPVRVTVTPDGIGITPATLQMVDSFTRLAAVAAPVLLKYNTTQKGILPIKMISAKWGHVVGNKAAGMGELHKVAARWNSKFGIPEGAFAIPFGYYLQHIGSPMVNKELGVLQQLERHHAPKAAIDTQLKNVRTAIKKQPIDAELLRLVEQQIKTNGKWTAYRFRSSSNAEDAPGFSGAGLYDSKTGKLNDPEKPIDAAIKKVWASAYSDAAYHERRACNIDERSMMMGVLAHRSFPDETANGVAITRNIYRNNFPGFTVNVQVGEVPVVAPPDSVTCEQFVCMKGYNIDPLNFDVTVDYLTMSNINHNKPVLTKKQITTLYEALAAVKSYFYYNKPDSDATEEQNYGLDIEFKFDNSGRLYLKQVRPYR